MCAYVWGGLVISVLCQLMRDERGHLFRGAGRRAVGWDSGMGDVGNSCWVLGVCVCVHDVYACTFLRGDVCVCLLLWMLYEFTLTLHIYCEHLNRCPVLRVSEINSFAGLWEEDSAERENKVHLSSNCFTEVLK